MRICFVAFRRFVAIKSRLNAVKHDLTGHNPASSDILLARGEVGLDVIDSGQARFPHVINIINSHLARHTASVKHLHRSLCHSVSRFGDSFGDRSLTLAILPEQSAAGVTPFRPQLLKWVGNKQRFAHAIIAHFPARFGAYHEPFLGAGGVLGTLAPRCGFASDAFGPLMEIWACLKEQPERLLGWYAERWRSMERLGKVAAYEAVKARYNACPNAADFLYLSRACYGGVVRFRKKDGAMSTPCGAHRPISPAAFAERVRLWHPRVQGVTFRRLEFADAMRVAEPGDLVYCDPPYSFSQAILYGAQSFSLEELLVEIARCKARGVFVALSIDGSKKSGGFLCDIPIPAGLFAREVSVTLGRSMLKRFQMEGRSLEREQVADRLLLTF